MLPYRSQLVETYPVLAQLYSKSGRLDRAVKALQRAVSLAEGLASDYPTFRLLTPEIDRLRIGCLTLQLRQGEVDVVLASAQALEAKKSLAPGNLYDLACIYALAAANPRTDKSAAEELLQHALALLRRVEEAGFFRTKARVEHARKDDDLKPLREREEFQKLLERAEKRIAAPSAPSQP